MGLGNFSVNRKQTLLAATVISAACLCMATTAMAQSVGAERSPEDQERLTQGIRTSNQAAAESYLRNLAEGAEVTYAQVLANPDDPALNAAYARTQISHGDILGASVTLERLLLVHPEAMEARLIYGLVLFRLDDTVTAKDVLQSIDPNQLPPDGRAERERVLALIEQRKKRLRQSITLTAGEHFDTDRNAAPNSGTILISNLPFTLQGNGRAMKDWGTLIDGAYDAEYDLGTDPRMSVFGGVNALSDTQAQVKTLNNQTGGLTTGLKFEDGPLNAMGGLFWNSMNLQSDYYLSDYGVNSRVGYKLQSDLEAFTELKYDIQAFHNVPADTSGHENSGTVPSAWVGLTWNPLPSHLISGSAGVTRRYAYAEYMSNSRLAGRLSDTWLLGQGQFLTTQGEYGGNVYDAPNTTLSTMTRHDHDIRVDLTYGLPMSTLADAVGGGELPEQLANIVLSANAEYYHSMSNMANYTYTNIRTQFLASKHWEF